MVKFKLVIKTIGEEYYFVTDCLVAITERYVEIYNVLGDLEHKFLLADIESIHPTTLSLREWMAQGVA